jgi:hypothetical protein
MLAEAKEIPIFSRFKHSERNYVARCYTSSNNPMVQLVEELSTLVHNPGRGENEQPLISEFYKEVTPFGHLIQSGNCPLAFSYTYKSLFCEAMVSFDKERQRKQRITTRNLKRYSKNENQQMFRHEWLKNGGQTIGFASVVIKDGHSKKFRIGKIVLTFMVEALAIGETLEIIKK